MCVHARVVGSTRADVHVCVFMFLDQARVPQTDRQIDRQTDRQADR